MWQAESEATNSSSGRPSPGSRYSHGAVYSNFEGKADLFLAVFEDYMAERVRELVETQAALPYDAPLEARARSLADQWMDRLARDRESMTLHMEFIAHADRDPELARRFGTRSMAMREAVAGYIAHYQQEAGSELAMPVDDLALVLRALGIGLAIESLVSPDTVRPRPLRRLRRATSLPVARTRLHQTIQLPQGTKR